MRRRTLQPRSPPSYIGVRMPSLARAPECDNQDGGGAATTREKVPRTLKSCITRAYSKTCDAARCTYREIIWRRDQPIGQSPRPCLLTSSRAASALKSFNHPCVLSLFSVVPQFE